MKTIKNTLIILLLLFIFPNAFSQNALGVKGQTLWLKGKNNAAYNLSSEKIVADGFFNFNPMLSSLDNGSNSKKGISNKYSLFVVFKSDVEMENPIVDLISNGEKITITNKQITSSKNNAFKKVDAKDGIVLSYLVSSENRGKKKAMSLFLENLSNPNTSVGSKNDLMELIYFPRVLNAMEQKKVESYLSIKYGISLLGTVDYLSSNSTKIWDSKENASYNNNVTGIGKEDSFGLFQKQSGNAKKDGLYIGFKNIAANNDKNSSALPNNTFLLWGHNNGSTTIKKEATDMEGIKKMKRVWKMQYTSEITSESNPTQIVLQKKEMALPSKTKDNAAKSELVWLVVSKSGSGGIDFENATYYKQSSEDEDKIIFNNVVWDEDKNGSDLFTFIKAPEFFVVYDKILPNCNLSENGKINLTIVGGKAPYQIAVKSKNFNTTFSSTSAVVPLTELPLGLYSINVSDGLLQNQEDTLTLDAFRAITVALAPQYSLDATSEVKIIPEIKNATNDKLSYRWELQDKIISTDSQLTANLAGDYQFTVVNSLGCEKKFPLQVSASASSQNGWSIFPNPATTEEPFTIQFKLKEPSEVSVALYDFSNRLLKTKQLGQITIFNYVDSLSVSGTYLLIITINGKSASAKLIVK